MHGEGSSGAGVDGLMVPEIRTETCDCVRRTIAKLGVA